MKSQILSFFRLVLILVLILLCLGLMAAAIAAYRLPQWAEIKFGPPSPYLSRTQLVLYSARLMAAQDALLAPENPQGFPRTFIVDLGEPVNSIVGRLEGEDFIPSADAFRTYLIYSGKDTAIQAGRYQLSPASTPLEIAAALQDPVPEDVEFNILPGWRAEEIAAALPTSGINVTPEAFLAVVNDPPADLIPPGFPALATLEGFLMPGNYTIQREISARDLLALFVSRFDEQVTSDLREAFASQGLSLDQAVTLASIVQREALVADEQPVIASVFYNRLGQGMKLDSDPTVQYALGFGAAWGGWWKSPLLTGDLQIDSRYNTYIYPGLPPGPIANPSLEALRATAYPEQSGYFYFRARCDGTRRHFFAETYEEHLQNACP